MLTIFYKFIIVKKLVVKVVYRDRADVLNDFLYNMEGVFELVMKYNIRSTSYIRHWIQDAHCYEKSL